MNPIKKNIAYFVIALLVGSFLTLGINNLEQGLEYYFFAEEFNSEPLTAQLVSAENKNVQKPQSEPKKFEVKLNANSALSVWTDLEDSKVLFQKNASELRPIASLSKLMTAYVVMELPETYSMDEAITVSKKSVEQDGAFGLKPGEKLSVKNLMAMALIESSNDAAFALADEIGKEGYVGNATGRKAFVGLMNRYAEKLNLNESKFSNPTGLVNKDHSENYSSARDLVKFSKIILKRHPEIFELSSHQNYRVERPDGSQHHYINENTNILLEEYPNMIGSKTGYTDGAEQCLLTVIKKDRGYLINVILGSNDRFGEMRKLIEQAQ